MSLARLQHDFTAWLQTDGPADVAPFGARAWPGLAIYRNNFRAQLAACLEESFEKTLQWLGAEAFHEAVVRHVERVPPSSWTLDAYPRDFPETLAMLYPQDPEVAELAMIELALADAFVGQDATSLTSEQATLVDWDKAILRFIPTLDFHLLTTPAPAIWSALVDGTAPPMIELLPQPGRLMIWRHEELPRFRTVDSAEERAILFARNGLPFADLCAQLVEDMGEAEGITVAGTWLGRWIADGLLTATTSAPESCVSQQKKRRAA